MDVVEIERAIADLSLSVKVPATADSAERAMASDYQMLVNALEEMLAGVEAPLPDVERLTALKNEVQRILQTMRLRTVKRIEAATRAVASGAPLDEFLKPQSNLAKATAIFEELSKKFIAAANRRATEFGAPPEGRDPVVVDSLEPTDDDADMSTPTQSEIDLKIENMQLRMDGRLSSIEGKMDALAAQVSGSERAMTLLAERAVAAAESAGNLKQTLWITSITTILSVLGIALAAYFGTQASNLGIVSSTISAFEAGRAAGAPQPATAPPQAAPTK